MAVRKLAIALSVAAPGCRRSKSSNLAVQSANVGNDGSSGPRSVRVRIMSADGVGERDATERIRAKPSCRFNTVQNALSPISEPSVAGLAAYAYRSKKKLLSPPVT